MKQMLICALVILALAGLTGCQQAAVPPTDSSSTPSGSVPLQTAPSGNASGWYTADGSTYYRLPDGSNMTGMVQIGENTYLFAADGRMQTGWVEQNGATYYFRADGAMARGQVEIEGRNHFFTASGKEVLVLLANGRVESVPANKKNGKLLGDKVKDWGVLKD